MIQCPKCKADIDADSWYCDQCGEQLLFCPKCNDGVPRKGKRCTQCGSVLVPGDQLASARAAFQQPKPAAGPSVQPQRPPQPPMSEKINPMPEVNVRPMADSATSRPQKAAGPSRMVMVNDLSKVVEFKDGGVIGRTTGDYLPVFSSNGYTSGRHARLQRAPMGWTITDLGSTNGTVVDGVMLTPNFPVPLMPSSIVEIGYVKFRVE